MKKTYKRLALIVFITIDYYLFIKYELLRKFYISGLIGFIEGYIFAWLFDEKNNKNNGK